MRKILILLSVLFAAFHTNAQTYTWNGQVIIHDLQTDTIPLSVFGLTNVIDSNYGVAHICININHSFKSDLVVSLLSPSGTLVTLIQGIGGSGDNFTGTCLGMDGTAFSNSSAPFTGIFFPAGDVSSFNNSQNPNGIWNLIVSDQASTDSSFVNSYSIEFVNNPPKTNNLPNPITTDVVYTCATCVCPGGVEGCDLLPDVTSSYKEILTNHTESPGLFNISNSTPNIGYGPIEIYGIDSCFCGGTNVPCNTVCPDDQDIKHVVKQRIYQKVPGTDTLSFYDRFAGEMTYHATHGHLHVDNWANYTIRSSTANPDARTWPILGTGVKQSFCLINLGTCATNPGECVDNNGNSLTTFPNNNFGFHTGCGLTQGIYPGNYDVYSLSLNDPIELNAVCDGNYYIVSITDPDNNFLESDESNNWVAVPITLSQQNLTPVINVSGSTSLCLGDSVVLSVANAVNLLWSTGETTQRIVVRNSGVYSVMNACGNRNSTPVTVSLTTQSDLPTVSISVTSGSNPGCSSDPLVFTAMPTNGGAAPVYDWVVNGISTETSGPVFSLPNHINGQTVSCQMTSSVSCLNIRTALSNLIQVQVNNSAPAISITQSKGFNPYCANDSVGFTATVSNGTNFNYQWKRNGINAGVNSPVYAYNNPINTETISCNISALPVCQTKINLGTGTVTNIVTNNYGAAYPTYYGNGKQQYLILASELLASGLTAGNINSVAFKTGAAVGNPSVLNDYAIRLASTTAAVLTTQFLNPAFSTVYGPVNYTPVINATNTHSFSSPFYWDGVSNILMEICFASGIYGTQAYQTYYSTTSFVSSALYQEDNASGLTSCTRVTGIGTDSKRPNMIFSQSPYQSASSNTILLTKAEPIYQFTGNGNWIIPSNWLNSKVPPAILPSCSEIIIDPITGGECLLNVQQIVSPGARISVRQNKVFKVPGNLQIQ